MTAVRVLSFNIQRGRSATGQNTTEAELAAAFDGLESDVVALQEVDRGQPRSGGIDQARVVAEALGLPHVRFAATLEGDVRRAKTSPARWGGHPGPAYGLAIASRYPITAWFVRPVPRVPFRLPALSGRRLVMRDDEPRGVLAAVLQTPSGPMSMCSAHLSLLGPVAAVQLPMVLRSMGRLPEPVLVCGDLNLEGWAVRRLARRHYSAPVLTFPADSPRRQIDHVLVRGARVTAASVAHRLPISDHRALAVTVEVGAPSRDRVLG
ncbi:MAG: endonuclease/exonuclease/phosphatase family protein [Actinomycetales bacterium]|nr:endonuclease/exonuclease/phosphatase family protein [Actinomycetales bacterium]